jgi:hypothetical protein
MLDNNKSAKLEEQSKKDKSHGSFDESSSEF